MTKWLNFVWLFAAQGLLAQHSTSGLIAPGPKDESCCIYMPKSGFTLYSGPGQSSIGKLEYKKNEDGTIEPYVAVVALNDQDSPKELGWDGLKEVGYEVLAITFFDRNSGFIRILNEQVNYWVEESEVTAAGYQVETWQEYMTRKAGKVLGFYPVEPLNLRAGPSTSEEKVKTLEGTNIEMTSTGEHKGQWSKVKVIKYKKHPCEGGEPGEENIEFELEGWVKAIDDSGSPNVWHFTRGC